jgi:hypothetical protein
MSFANFIPTVVSQTVLKELERKRIFVADCHNEYKGEITEAGDSIVFTGLANPTIFEVDYKDRNEEVHAPEALEDLSLKMDIRKIADFHFFVDDIDKALASKVGLRESMADAAAGLADKHDRYVANLAASKEMPRLVAGGVKATVGSTSGSTMNVLDIIDLARQRLSENDVPNSTEVILTVPPRFYTLVKKVYRDLDTDNSEIMQNGRVGRYGGVTIKESNNCARSADGLTDHIMIRTKAAIGFAEAFNKTRAYQPEGYWREAIMGRSLYDAKIIRPKQCFGIDVTYN